MSAPVGCATVSDSTRRRGDPVGGLIVAIGALLFGGIVVLGRFVAERGLPVTSVLAIRFAVAGLLLGVVLVVSRQSLRPAPGEGGRLVALGAVGYAVESALFFLALGRGTAATVTLLFYTYPAWVAVLSALLGLGVPGLLLVGSLVAAISGAGLVAASSGGLDITGSGIAFALGSAVAIAIYLVAFEALARRTSVLASAMWVSLSASAALAAYTVISGTGRLPVGLPEWLALLGMGVLTAGAFFMLFLGVRRLGAVRSSIISSLEPVFAAVLAFVFLDESLRAGVIVGGALILAGAIAASLARRAPEPEEAIP
jgi:drug/metabolite transporter (DMT)-like permease